MRKLFSFILLVVYLFNFGGYSLLFQALIEQSDKQLAKQLDHNSYSKNDLVEVKVPLNLPYQTSRKNYERIDGAINLNGMHYNYVMRKINRDTLFILCIANPKKTLLCKAQNNFQKLVNEIPTNKKSDNGFKKTGAADEHYFPHHYSYARATIAVRNQVFVTVSSLHDCFIATDDRPPEV